MPGKNFIKVSSILLAISGVFGIVAYFLMGIIMSMGSEQEGSSTLLGLCVLFTVLSVLQLAAAVKGIKNCNSKEAASGLKKWGIVLIALAAVNIIASVVGAANSADSSAMPASIFSLVLPIIYYIGASKNAKA